MSIDPVTVILIVHNEAETIASEVEAFHRAVVAKIPGSELLVAEDGSSDGTDEILRELVPRFSLRLVQEKIRKGYTKAVLDTLRLPAREWMFFSDTGGKFEPEDFWRLEALRAEADLIIGLRDDRRDRWYRRILTRGLNRLVRDYFRVPLRDCNSGFRLFRKELIQQALSPPLIFNELIATEITLRMVARGARWREVPVRYAQRHGPSRGLPIRRIPGAVFSTVRAFPRLRHELRNIK